MTTYVFQEVKTKRTVKVRCIKCGKKLSRVVEAFQTVNPYNINMKGHQKTEKEIREELLGELIMREKAISEKTVCKGCAVK